MLPSGMSVVDAALELGRSHAPMDTADGERDRTLAARIRQGHLGNSREDQGANVTPDVARNARTLEGWRRAVKIYTTTHDFMHRRYDRIGQVLTVIVVIFNAIVGSAVFTTLSGADGPGTWVAIVAGVISMCNSVLSAVKSALAFEKKSELHRITSLRYRKLWVRFDDIRYAQGVPYLERQTQSQIAGQRQAAWADDSGLMRKSETWAEWFKDCLDVMEMAPSISDELYDYYASKLS